MSNVWKNEHQLTFCFRVSNCTANSKSRRKETWELIWRWSGGFFSTLRSVLFLWCLSFLDVILVKFTLRVRSGLELLGKVLDFIVVSAVFPRSKWFSTIYETWNLVLCQCFGLLWKRNLDPILYSLAFIYPYFVYIIVMLLFYRLADYYRHFNILSSCWNFIFMLLFLSSAFLFKFFLLVRFVY